MLDANVTSASGVDCFCVQLYYLMWGDHVGVLTVLAVTPDDRFTMEWGVGGGRLWGVGGGRLRGAGGDRLWGVGGGRLWRVGGGRLRRRRYAGGSRRR